MWTDFQMFKLVFEKAEEPEIKLPTSDGSQKKQESSRKTSPSALLTTPNLWLCGSQQTMENSSKDGNTSLSDSGEICMQVNRHHLELDVEQETGSRLGKEYVKTVYCSPCLFNLYTEYIVWNARLDES